MTISFTMPVFAENPKIAIIGAGLAGLTAAYRLQKNGIEVDLYEARNRVGGRILTIFLNGHIAELGGQNIADGGEAEHLLQLINEFGLEIVENRVSLNQHYFDGKEFISVNQLLREKEFDPQKLRDLLLELSLKSQNMKQVLQGIIAESDPLYKMLEVRLAAYEGAPLEKLSPLYTETLFHILLGGICLAHQGNTNEEENFLRILNVKDGNAQLLEKIAEFLDSKLHLNMQLKSVSRNDAGRFALHFYNDHKAHADILILAIPCSVYESINFEENVLPFDRKKAIQSIQYGTNAKILVPCFSDSKKKRVVINDHIISFLNASQNILTLYHTNASSFFSENTIAKSFEQIRPLIEKSFGENCPCLIPPVLAQDQNFVSYNTPVGYSWPNDPFAKGSYSYISPGQEELYTSMIEENGEIFKSLFRPINHLYFVGEQASVLTEVPGTMEAACESGERIARVILNWCKKL